MREFLISGEHELDTEKMAWLNEEGDKPFFPCSRIRFNDRIKMAYFTDGYISAQEILPRMTLDEICALCKQLLMKTEYLEREQKISLEQVVWDPESIYVHREAGTIRLIALPVKPAGQDADSKETDHEPDSPEPSEERTEEKTDAESVTEEARESNAPQQEPELPEKPALSSEDQLIYRKRIYALLTELCAGVEGGDVMIRQIEHQQAEDPGNWEALRDVLDRRIPEEDDMIVLRSSGAEKPLIFRISHGIFGIGSDPERADGVIPAEEGVSPLHAVVGWNEISFFVTDLESENGTWLNDTRIAPGTQVPFGKGSSLMFGKCRFEAE